MTNQEAFDRALQGIRAQGYRQSGSGGVCMYRGPDGLKCGVGHCIPDEEYRAMFEQKAIHVLFQQGVVISSLVGVDRRLLNQLQRAHDSLLGGYNYFPWERRMQEIALQSGLKYTPLTPEEK